MTNYYISIPLAAERRQDMLAEAEAARSLPGRRKSSWNLPGSRSGPRSTGGGRLTVLRDGSEVPIPSAASPAPDLAAR